MRTFLEYVNESGQRNVWTKELAILFINELRKNVYIGHRKPTNDYTIKEVTYVLTGTKYKFGTSNKMSICTENLLWWTIPNRYRKDIEDEYDVELNPYEDVFSELSSVFDEEDDEDFKILQDIYKNYLEVDTHVNILLPHFLKEFEKKHGIKIKAETKENGYHLFTIIGGSLNEKD